MGVAYCLKMDPTIKGFDSVLDGIISFSSIVLGFVAALLAIILSISKSTVMNHLYNFVGSRGAINGKTLLFGFFKSSLYSGFATVIISIFMYVISNKEKIVLYEEIITYIWVGVTIFFVCSSYRIVSILMHTLFKHESHETNSHEQVTQPSSDYNQLQQRNTRNINNH